MNEPKIELREPVKWFAEQMETELRKHDQTKGVRGWLGECPKEYLIFQVMYRQALMFQGICTADTEDTIREAVHLANFAMMIADKALQ